MPHRIVTRHIGPDPDNPAVREQRYEWYFDPGKTATKVLPTASQYRTAGGVMEARPSLWNGDLVTVSCSFGGASWQNLTVTWSAPIDWVQITARNDGRVPACSAVYAGAALVPNLVTEFGPATTTREYHVARAAGALVFSTAAGAGTLRFMEIVGWAEA